MPKVFVVEVEQLNFHSEPGGDDTITSTRPATRGERYAVREEREGPQVNWVRVFGGWLARENKNTRQRFGRLEEVLPPVVQQDPPWWDAVWKALPWPMWALVVFCFVIVIAVSIR